MTSYVGHIWILFTSILLFFGAHAKPSEWACYFIKRTRAGEIRQGGLRRFDEAIARFVDGNFNCHFLEVCYDAQAVSASASHEISHMRTRYSDLSMKSPNNSCTSSLSSRSWRFKRKLVRTKSRSRDHLSRNNW